MVRLRPIMPDANNFLAPLEIESPWGIVSWEPPRLSREGGQKEGFPGHWQAGTELACLPCHSRSMLSTLATMAVLRGCPCLVLNVGDT